MKRHLIAASMMAALMITIGTFATNTVALTGQGLIVLAAAAVLTLMVSLFLLHRYRRAVIKSMRGQVQRSAVYARDPPGQIALVQLSGFAPGRLRNLVYGNQRRRVCIG